MNKIRVSQLSVVAALVVLGSALAMAQQATASNNGMEQSLTGTITSTGRLTHQYSCQRNQTLQTCTLASVEQGSQFVLLVGDNSYVLEVSRHMIESYAGGKATVTGLVSNDHIYVHAVSKAKQEDSREGL
jgi:uncharacterized membrane protein YcgQ (UPF0703/DUF1980 family)